MKNNKFSQAAGFTSIGQARMTIAGALNKALFLGFLVLVGAAFDAVIFYNNPNLALGAGIIAMFVAFGVAIATSFKPEWSPTTAPIYALVEGVAVGAFSIYYSQFQGGIVPGAIMLTTIIFLVMAGLYRAGILRATPRFVQVVTFATIGIAFTYLIAIGLSFVGIHLGFFFAPTLLGIGFSLFAGTIAALNLIIDFGIIDQGAANGAPKYMEWYGAFSLLVTVVWIYLEMLRLLSNISRR